MTDRDHGCCRPIQRTELVWPGKRTQVERIALPFQVVETINVSRATREQAPMDAALAPPGRGNPEPDGWRNKLIWGDNKYVLASLLEGDPAVGLEPLAGKIDLIYIDPPFDTGDDFSFRLRVVSCIVWDRAPRTLAETTRTLGETRALMTQGA